MADDTKQQNPYKIPKLKQCIEYNESLINLLVVTSFKYFYSNSTNKWYIGYYTNTGNWTTLDSSYDQEIIMEKFNTLKLQLLK